MKKIILHLVVTAGVFLVSTASFASSEMFCFEADHGIQINFSREVNGNLVGVIFLDTGWEYKELMTFRNVRHSVDNAAEVATETFQGNDEKSKSTFNLTILDHSGEGLFKGELNAVLSGQELMSPIDPESKPQLHCRILGSDGSVE